VQATPACKAPSKLGMILSLPPIKNGMFEKDFVAKDLKRRGSYDDPI